LIQETNNPKVSVIIPNYNYAKYVAEAINSALNQTYSNLEVIVVNNGSTDNSLEVLKTFGEKIVLIDQENLGQSGARNVGLNHVSGELIAFLDADDIWKVDKLERQIRLICEETQLVFSGIVCFENEVDNVTELHKPVHRGACSDTFLRNPTASVVLAGESTALFTKKLVSSVGSFDELLNSAAGWDFFRRCSNFTDFDFVDEPLVLHRVHSSNMSHAIDARINDMRLSFFKMHPDVLRSLGSIQAYIVFCSMEVNFIKTYLRERRVKKVIGELFRILTYPLNLQLMEFSTGNRKYKR